METVKITMPVKRVTGDITERVKTFEDACEVLGIDPGDIAELKVATALKGDLKAIIAFIKLTIVARALNEGWLPDWANSNQRKYYPWMEYSAGSGFSFIGCDCVRTYTLVGSRLCFKSDTLAKYAATQFPELYNDLFN